MKARLDAESHSRAFVSHFKIELNNLVGSSGPLAASSNHILPHNGNYSSYSSSGTTSIDDLPRNGRTRNETESTNTSSTSSDVPIITINGEDSGQYELNGRETSSETDLDNSNTTTANNNNNNAGPDGTCEQAQDTATGCGGGGDDDGYRSLGSDGCRPNLTHQLNEIKSRLLDLIDEIDRAVESHLGENDMCSYRRRCRALIELLDSMVDAYSYASSHKQARATGAISSSRSQPNLCRASTIAVECYLDGQLPSELLPRRGCPGDYEEQVHVIDYDFKRRASDSNALKRARASISTAQESEVGQFLKQTRQIDFGAMMRDYETAENLATTKSTEILDMKQMLVTNDKSDQQQLGPMKKRRHRQAVEINNINVQHKQTYSSGSSYSTSSHTSSSSFL